MIDKWDQRFLDISDVIANWSKDRSTSVGAVIVHPETRSIIGQGYNGFPRGVQDDIDERHERPTKYLYTEHAERNAIYHAARLGHAVAGCTLYLRWFPCADCARAIIQAGITWVVCGMWKHGERPEWDDSFLASQVMLSEANVEVEHWESPQPSGRFQDA